MPAAPSPSQPGLRTLLSRNRCVTLNVILYLVGALTFFLLILRRTHGHFTYCLDDPYIHLALAERLHHGLYGINAGEAASPSSSILWPLLLVPFAGTALLSWMPLIFNILASTGTAALLGHFVDRLYPSAWNGEQRTWRAPLLSVLLLLSTNLFGLTYTGLEHPLEVLLCVAAAFAFVHLLDGERIPLWTIASAALLPSVRYEGLLITFAVAVALWAVRARRSAVALLPISLLPAALFSLYLRHLGLPAFPLSVLVKSSYKFQDQSSLPIRVARLVVETTLATLRDPERAPQLLLVVVLACLAWHNRRTRSVALALIGAALAGLAQVFLGPVGWFFRYEIYCLAFTLLIAIAADRRTASTVSSPTAPGPVPGMLLVLTGALAMFYARAQLGIPQAALGIYQQQTQLARFTTEFYPGPVAVNDLGLISFRRTPDQYVLDLVGLGSFEAFQTKEQNRTPAWLDRITREHSIGLVIIYPEWFKLGVPATWSPVAKLCAADVDPTLGAANARVMFYATPLADRGQVLAKLANLRATLPSGSTLQLQPDNTSTSCADRP